MRATERIRRNIARKKERRRLILEGKLKPTKTEAKQIAAEFVNKILYEGEQNVP